jgi:hypothetical protein
MVAVHEAQRPQVERIRGVGGGLMKRGGAGSGCAAASAARAPSVNANQAIHANLKSE